MVNPILIGSVLGSTVAYLKKIGKIPYTLEEALEILMGHPIGDDVTWDNNEDNLGDEVTWNAAPQQTKVKFPRAKADKIVKKVEKHLKPYVVDQMACGSYRRGAQMIGDIDFVLILKPGYELPEVLPANEGINWVGNQKAQVIIDGEKVDFRVTTPDAWGATILYFTGPADFNIKYRWMAKKKGLKLSEYGLFDRNTGQYIAGKTENDIFTALGRPYKNPDVRKGFRAEGWSQRFEAPYQPNQSLEDYSHQDLMTSSVVTGDFTTDSLKYGFGPTALSAEERFYYHGTDARSLASILEEGIKPTGVEDSVWNEELEDVSPHPYYYEEVDDFLPSVFVAETPEEARWWAEEAGNTEIVVLKISSQVENLANFSDDGVGGWRTSETIPTNYIIDIMSSETFEAEDDVIRVYRRMSWEQYFDVLETGYLMPPKMRSELDGFKNSKSFGLQSSTYAARSPSFRSPLEHLQKGVLPIFEIELLPTDEYRMTRWVVEIDNAIPADRVTPFFTSEKVSTFEAEDNYEATYGKEQAKIRRRLKNKIMKQAIMGTKAGQWSARKSQELKRQYEAACEKRGLRAYKGNKTQKQQNLTDWSRQKWGTASGKKSSKTGEPYFPAKAIEALKDRGLYAKAKRQKQAATKAGKQHARYSDDIREVVKPFRGEMDEYPFEEIDNSFTSMPNLAYITLPNYEEAYYWISADGNSRATVAYDDENEVIVIPNFEVSQRVRGQKRAHQYLQELIDDAYRDGYPVQVTDVDNHAIGFWEKMQTQGLIEGWSQGSFASESFEAPLGRRSRRQSKILNEAEKIMGTKIWTTPELQEALLFQGIETDSRTLGYLLGIDSRFEMMGKTKTKSASGRSYEVNTWRLAIKEAESFVTLDIKDMDRFLRNRRFKPVDIVYRNRPVKEWVYERALPGRPNHVVRVYTSINRYGQQKGRGRDVGRDAIRVQVIYRDSKGETLVSSPTRVHRIGTWEKNLDQRLKMIAEEKPQVAFDSRGEPMTLRKYKGKLFWGSRDYPHYKETKSI